MTRALHVFIGFAALAVHALAQVAPAAAVAPGAVQAPAPGAGRGGGAPITTGPSAPVPPEVTIPRPTPDDVAQVNNALARWVASDNSTAKPLLQKYQSLMMLQPPRLNVAATYTQTQQRIGPRHLGFVETASKGNIDF